MTIARRPIAERVISSITALSTAAPGVWSADAASDVITCSVAHGLVVNTPIAFGAGTGALPAGLAAEPEYYWVVAVPTTTTLTVSLTYGGTAVNITDAGTAGWVVRVLPGWVKAGLPVGTFSLRALGSVDVLYGLAGAKRNVAGQYPNVEFAPNTAKVYPSIASILGKPGEYRFFSTSLMFDKKYNRFAVRIHMEMLGSSAAVGRFSYHAVGATDAAFTTSLAYLNSTIGFYIDLSGGADITSVSLSDGYGGYALSGATVQVIAAAR